MSTPALNIPRPGPKPVAAAPRTNRMTLDKVTRGKLQKPHRTTLYGVEGIGKSTFAANAPKPIFLGAEQGTNHLDVARMPAPETWADVLDAIETLRKEPHDFQTLAVDSLDWMEPLLNQDVCKRNDWANLDAPGFGKGPTAALDEWRVFLRALERLQTERSMHLVLIAHSFVKPFKNPEGPDFDRYQMKIQEKAAGLVKEWSEDVLFANHETFTAVDKQTKRHRGITSGVRLVYTVRTAAYDAKNRHNLPESLPLGWADYDAACTQGAAANEAVRVAIREKAERLDDATKEKALGALGRAGDDPEKLAQLNTWVNSQLPADN